MSEFALPQYVGCGGCGEELELDAGERAAGRFDCPFCGTSSDDLRPIEVGQDELTEANVFAGGSSVLSGDMTTQVATAHDVKVEEDRLLDPTEGRLVLDLNGLRDLFFDPGAFFSRRVRSGPLFPLLVWMVGAVHVIDRLDRRLINAELYSRATPEFAVSWFEYLMTVALVGLASSPFIWLIGGWWFRVRLRWSGASQPTKQKPRRVFVYARTVATLPAVVLTMAMVLVFDNYAEYWASDELWSTILLVFPFWSVYVGYKGATTAFDADPRKARWWFLILPVVLYLAALVFFGVALAAAGLE